MYKGLIVLIFVFFLALPATAQDAFPPYDPANPESSAAGAAMLYQLSSLGLTAPPVGGYARVSLLPTTSQRTFTASPIRR